MSHWCHMKQQQCKLVKVHITVLLLDLFKLCWLMSKNYCHLILGFDSIDGVMRCINCSWNKYDITEGLDVRCTAHHIITLYHIVMALKATSHLARSDIWHFASLPHWGKKIKWVEEEQAWSNGSILNVHTNVSLRCPGSSGTLDQCHVSVQIHSPLISQW